MSRAVRAHRGEQAQFGVDGLAIAHAVSVNALPSVRYAGVASTTLKGEAVCTTRVIRNPACPSSALYSAAPFATGTEQQHLQIHPFAEKLAVVLGYHSFKQEQRCAV